jgi:hypothetical protein
MRSDITFTSEGTVCRGWLYLPDARSWFTTHLGR